ncbi:MAG TPA: tetratricopeptide repeat protein [Planctomycetota bacterium]|nr:tetratricopeptide repeat protein [Planctomycetota bacterium]
MTALLLLLLFAGDLDAAEKALAAGKPEDAIEKLGDLADAKSADPRVYAVLGRAYLQLGDPQAAVEPLVRASEKLPEDKALARDAAIACYRSAQGAYGRLYLEDAKRLATRAGDDAFLAEIEYLREDYEAALALYRKVDGAAALTRVAECLKLLGRADEAKEAYGKALEAALSEGNLESAFSDAFSAGRGGRFVAWLDERIKANPDDLKARYYRGFARVQLAMYPEAIEDLRFFLAKEPNAVAARDQLSLALVQNGFRLQDKAMIGEAGELARQVLDADPGNRGAWERLRYIAGYWWQNGNVQGIYDVMKDLHARDPEDAAAAVDFAMAARRLGHYDEARQAYEGILKDAPDDPTALVDIGILLDGQGDRAGARARWEKVLAAEPANLDALENLFTDAWERGDTVAARDYARRGLEAAKAANGPVSRWEWFADRLLWAPRGCGG